ncbi:hypothetical protein ACF1G0_16430 [Streptomyces sp. NPDC013953]|uniref:hypothetical protein n=1 Tax=Streptomyces sp. NPDC013953 TaxID=3364868 RepID=UPI0036FF6A5D
MNDRPALPPHALLLFDRDDGVCVLPSYDAAENSLEAADVAAGKYEAYAPDGRVVRLAAPGGPYGPVSVTATGEFDPAGLEARIVRVWRDAFPGETPPGAAELARTHLEREPKAPRRLFSFRFRRRP